MCEEIPALQDRSRDPVPHGRGLIGAGTHALPELGNPRAAFVAVAERADSVDPGWRAVFVR
jgi:hypothetical protein